MSYNTLAGSSVASNPISMESDNCKASENPRKKDAASCRLKLPTRIRNNVKAAF
jgi:hypothetical protein